MTYIQDIPLVLQKDHPCLLVKLSKSVPLPPQKRGSILHLLASSKAMSPVATSETSSIPLHDSKLAAEAIVKDKMSAGYLTKPDLALYVTKDHRCVHRARLDSLSRCEKASG